MNGLAVIGVCGALCLPDDLERRPDGAELSAELETVSQSRLKSLFTFLHIIIKLQAVYVALPPSDYTED